MNRPGSPLENQLQDIMYGTLFNYGPYSTQVSSPLNAICPQCGKTVKAVGLGDHIRDVHEQKTLEK